MCLFIVIDCVMDQLVLVIFVYFIIYRAHLCHNTVDSDVCNSKATRNKFCVLCQLACTFFHNLAKKQTKILATVFIFFLPNLLHFHDVACI